MRIYLCCKPVTVRTVSQACKLRHEAQALARTAQDKVQAHQRFKSAGNLFASPELQQMPEASNAAVQCYCSAHAFEEAARTCTELCQPPRYGFIGYRVYRV